MWELQTLGDDGEWRPVVQPVGDVWFPIRYDDKRDAERMLAKRCCDVPEDRRRVKRV